MVSGAVALVGVMGIFSPFLLLLFYVLNFKPPSLFSQYPGSCGGSRRLGVITG